MSRRHGLLLLLMVLAAMACRANDPGVAQVGERRVSHEEIRCPARQAGGPDCLAVEQANLDRVIADTLLDRAASRAGIRVTDEAARALYNGPFPTDAVFEAAEGRLKTTARAVVAVYGGENADRVFEEQLAPHGITREQFDSAMKTWSRETAERVVREDQKSKMRQQLLEPLRRKETRRQVGLLIANRARAQSVSYRRAARDFWEEELRHTPVTISDSRFEMPDLEMLLP